MSTPESTSTPEYVPPQWVKDLTPENHAEYLQARTENIEEMVMAVRHRLEGIVPGMSMEQQTAFDAIALAWATSSRNNFERGMQAGKDAWEQRDTHAQRFMRNVIGG